MGRQAGQAQALLAGARPGRLSRAGDRPRATPRILILRSPRSGRLEGRRRSCVLQDATLRIAPQHEERGGRPPEADPHRTVRRREAPLLCRRAAAPAFCPSKQGPDGASDRQSIRQIGPRPPPRSGARRDAADHLRRPCAEQPLGGLHPGALRLFLGRRDLRLRLRHCQRTRFRRRLPEEGLRRGNAARLKRILQLYGAHLWYAPRPGRAGAAHRCDTGGGAARPSLRPRMAARPSCRGPAGFRDAPLCSALLRHPADVCRHARADRAGDGCWPACLRPPSSLSRRCSGWRCSRAGSAFRETR